MKIDKDLILIGVIIILLIGNFIQFIMINNMINNVLVKDYEESEDVIMICGSDEFINSQELMDVRATSEEVWIIKRWSDRLDNKIFCMIK